MGRVDDRNDTECFEVGFSADTREHQELWGSDRALADDDLPLGRECVFFVIGTVYADSSSGLVFIKYDLFRDGIGEECDVGFPLDKETSVGSNTIVYRVDASEQTCLLASDGIPNRVNTSEHTFLFSMIYIHGQLSSFTNPSLFQRVTPIFNLGK